MTSSAGPSPVFVTFTDQSTCFPIATRGGTALVASAEESIGQVGLRAGRLGVTGDAVMLSAERDVDAIIEAARSVSPDLLVVDSIQTNGCHSRAFKARQQHTAQRIS